MSSATKKPNVLMFIPHDLGDYLHCYGHEDVKSENLDALSQQGVQFTGYFTVAPECCASRSSMYTGQYPYQNGMVGLCFLGWKLNNPKQHLANRMREGGYETHLFGTQHETRGPVEELGYTHHTSGRNVSTVCDDVVEFLGKPRDDDSPWFLNVGFQEVHRPWPQHTTFNPDEIQLPPYLPDTPEVREDYSYFYQNILDMDQAIGKVLNELDRLGLRDDTLVIFTTDHGSPFPRAKATFYDPGIQIPLIMSHPKLERGKPMPALCSVLDFTPTVLDFCGLPTDEDNMEGRSMLPLLMGEADRLHTEIFGAMFYDVSYDPLYYVRTQKFKYIRSYAVDPAEAANAEPITLTSFKAGQWIRFEDYDVMTSPTWKSMDEPCDIPCKEELYDLVNDPYELKNLCSESAFSGELDQMRQRLKTMMRDTGSPLPDSHIQPNEAQISGAAKYKKILGITV
ncbi:MAG: sulfatase [Phycisphaeraceae bacterium]|nr:sulfatase [Phycisphaeraceae bacterium]